MQSQTLPLVDLRKVPTADLNYYFDRLMPRNLPVVDPNDKYDNAIEQRHIYIYGKQGKGKTNVTKLIVNRAVQTYGSFNVAVQRTNAENFRQLLEGNWERKLIQVIILEDATDVGIPKDELAAFFRIRHKMYEKTGAREGLVIVIFCCHRLHETPIALRSDYDSLLVLGVPMNDWDYNFIASKVGVESVEILDEADENNEKGNVIVTYRRKFLGIAKIPKLTFDIPIRDIVPSVDLRGTSTNFFKQRMQVFQPRQVQRTNPVESTRNGDRNDYKFAGKDRVKILDKNEVIQYVNTIMPGIILWIGVILYVAGFRLPHLLH